MHVHPEPPSSGQRPRRAVSTELMPALPGAGLEAAKPRCAQAGPLPSSSGLARKLPYAQRCLLQVASSLLAEVAYCTAKQELLEFRKSHVHEVHPVCGPHPRFLFLLGS